VCSAFVAAMYKAAGIIPFVQATEFTPKDVYTLAVFDSTTPRPYACTLADPDQPWCQILGKYRMTLPEYNTIVPYSNMAEKCPTIAPEYVRTPGC
jgi:hypothetical protein